MKRNLCSLDKEFIFIKGGGGDIKKSNTQKLTNFDELYNTKHYYNLLAKSIIECTSRATRHCVFHYLLECGAQLTTVAEIWLVLIC